MGKIFLKEAIGCQMKKTQCHVWETTSQEFGQEWPRDHHNKTDYCHCLGCPPKFHGKCLVLKIPHISHSTWINKADTDKVASCLLAAFIILEGAR